MPVSRLPSQSDSEADLLNLPQISLIVAMTPARIIGRDGGLPWHLSADLQHFKKTTMAKPIVMGRKTYESIGRPLPGRQNIVITATPDFHADGVVTVASLEQALQQAAAAPEIMVIGGAQIYTLALRQAKRLYLTWVLAEIDGDTKFPVVSWDDWRIISRSATQTEDGVNFYFCCYERLSN